jgi:DNA-binding NarL/FixJ family response regulator
MTISYAGLIPGHLPRPQLSLRSLMARSQVRGRTREKGPAVTQSQGSEIRPLTAVAERRRVLLVDANRSFAELLGGALDVAGMTWIGSAHSTETGVAMSRRLQPDVVVLDINLSRPEEGLAAIQLIRAAAPGTAVAVVTGYRDFVWVTRSAQAGAAAFISKHGSVAEMLSVLAQARPGAMIVAQTAFQSAPVQSPPHSAGPAPRRALTRRERDVLGCMSRGLGNKMTSTELGITREIYRSAVRAIEVKLGARSQLEAVLIARRLGLVTSQATL